MRVNDQLLFAPGIHFHEVDLDGPLLPSQLAARIHGFYLEPSKACADGGHAFASGVILVCAIDALARYRYPAIQVGPRIRALLSDGIAGFASKAVRIRFYSEVRNGLVHEGRLKNGAQFTLESDQTALLMDGLLLVNPDLLLGELSEWLNRFVTQLRSHPPSQMKLAQLIRNDLKVDLEGYTPEVDVAQTK